MTATDPLPAPPRPVARPLAAPYLGPLEAVRMGFHRYADFRGRASRPEYWWWVLFNLLTTVVASIVGEWALVLAWLTLVVPSLSVTWRRLHDSGRSAWFQLLALVPFAGSIALIVLLSLPSDEGPNRFGPAWY